MKEDITNEPKKLTNWANEPEVSELKTDYDRAKSFHSEQIAKVEKWDDLLNITNSAKIPKQQGKSNVQPRVIRKQAEWRYSSLSEPFLAQEDVFTIEPKTWADVESAKQNELVLNYQFNNQLNKVNLIDNLVRAVVNDGTAIIRVSWEYEESIVSQTITQFDYQEVTDPQIAQQIMQATQAFQQKDPSYAQLPEQIQESVRATIENNRPIQATPTKQSEENVVKVIKNQPKIDICDLQNVIVDPTCNGDFNNAQFIVYAFETSLSDLKKSGEYKNLDLIKVDSVNPDGYVKSNEENSFQYSDKPRKKITVFEYWGYWDIDNSGITSPIVATWVGDVMIRMERNPYPDGKIPFVIIPYLPVKNSIYGESDAVLLEDNQKLTGALTRGMVDAMAKSANAQTGIRKDALDAVNRRKFKSGEDYEFNPTVDPRQAIITHTYPELPQSTYNMVQMFQAEAEAMTGVKTFNDGLSGNSYGGSATTAGVQGVLSATGKRESAILRRLAKGMELVGSKILAMNSVWLGDDEVIRITDESFVAINRENLTGSFDIKLSISTPENNAIKAQELSFMLQTMGQTLPFDITKIILSEIAHLQNMPALSSQLINYQPPPDPMQQLNMQKAQLELQQMQVDIQKEQIAIKAQQSHIEKQLAQAQLFSSQARLADLQYVEQESGVTQQRSIELQQAQAQGNLQRDFANQILSSQMASQALANETGKPVVNKK